LDALHQSGDLLEIGDWLIFSEMTYNVSSVTHVNSSLVTMLLTLLCIVVRTCRRCH